MQEWMKIFSGSVSTARVNVVGIIMMAVAVLMVVLAGKASGQKKNALHNTVWYAMKFGGLLLCAAGAFVAIMK